VSEQFTRGDVVSLLLEVMDWTYVKAHRETPMSEAEKKVLDEVRAALAEPEHIHTCGPDCQKPPCVNRRREIAAAVEAEREACLKAAEQAKMHQMVWYPKGYTIDANKVNEMYTAQHVRCVEAIRARGSK